MKPRAFVQRLACAGLWLIASWVAAEPLIAPTAIDWLLDCPFPALERPDPEVLERTQCGTVSVPRDHTEPKRGSVRLGLTRVGARDPLGRKGVVFIQSGEAQAGQGETFVLHLVGRWESYATPAYRELVNRYDVIELSARDLTDENGIEQAAHDMEYIRAQLGEAQLNYLGNADATGVGSRYAELFSGRIARMVLVNAGSGARETAGVEQLLLRESTQAGAGNTGCVNRWLGDFLIYGRQPPAATRCLDLGKWD